MNPEDNKRGYFRIDDDVFLYFKKADEDALADTETYFETFRQSTILTAQFHQQRTAMATVLSEINSRDTSVASYLSMLSNQVDVLAKKLLTSSVFAPNERLQHVNISADGMRFHSSDGLKEGDKLEMIYVLLPGGDYIPVLAEVTRTEPDNSSDGCFVSVKYINMNEDDRELVIHHIMFLQRQFLQQKRLTG